MREFLYQLLVLGQAEGGGGTGGGEAQGGDPLSGCLSMAPVFLIMIAIFYFMVIRPQRKQQLEQSRFLERLKEGDRVITTSGILGRIVNLEAGVVTLDVGDRTRIRFLRNQVARLQSEAEDVRTSRAKSSDREDPLASSDKSTEDARPKGLLKKEAKGS